MRFVSSSCSFFGRQLARFLTKPAQRHDAFAVSDITTLRATLQPGDVLLVEGNTRISTAIKYLTQSSWSHAAFYVGDALTGNPHWQGDLIEADLVKGVTAVSLENYSGFNTRICRPLGLSGFERGRLVEYMEAQLGHQYDLRNIVDLMRYLLPTPPVPSWMRRRLLAFGSGDPTRGICSTIIAQAFQSLRYPIPSEPPATARIRSRPASRCAISPSSLHVTLICRPTLQSSSRPCSTVSTFVNCNGRTATR